MTVDERAIDLTVVGANREGFGNNDRYRKMDGAIWLAPMLAAAPNTAISIARLQGFPLMSATSLARTPLFDAIAARGARLVPFAGWEMPVQFTGLKQEHLAVRSAVGMFDISHMGKFLLRGPQVLAVLQPLVPTDLLPLQPGRAQYTVLLNPEGGIIDDLIIYAQGPEAAVIIANAATTEKDRTWLQQHLSDKGVELADVSRDRALIAVQGPQAIATVRSLLADDPGQLLAFGHFETKLEGEEAFVARTGYTGEDGVEMMIPASIATQVWERLLAAGVEPCGLGARDTLRLEAAMGLYGQDMNETISPLEAGLGWLVHLDRKGDFIGRAVLERQKAAGVAQKLVGLEMSGRHIARHDYPIQHEGQTVGIVTSGTLAPTVGKAIALGYVPTALAKPGQALEVTIRGKNHPATVVKKPFYRTSAPAPRG